MYKKEKKQSTSGGEGVIESVEIELVQKIIQKSEGIRTKFLASSDLLRRIVFTLLLRIF